MSCPTCSASGEHYRGPPRAELMHYAARAIWALHEARRAAGALGLVTRTAMLSALIRTLESLLEETKPRDH